MHAGMGRKCLCRQILFLPPIQTSIPRLLGKSRPPSPSEMQPARRFHIRAQHTQPIVLFALSTTSAAQSILSASTQIYLYIMHLFGFCVLALRVYETKLVTHWRFWFYVLTMSLFSDTLSTCEMWIYLFPWHTPLMLRCSALFGIYCSTFPAAEQTRLFFLYSLVLFANGKCVTQEMCLQDLILSSKWCLVRLAVPFNTKPCREKNVKMHIFALSKYYSSHYWFSNWNK